MKNRAVRLAEDANRNILAMARKDFEKNFEKTLVNMRVEASKEVNLKEIMAYFRELMQLEKEMMSCNCHEASDYPVLRKYEKSPEKAEDSLSGFKRIILAKDFSLALKRGLKISIKNVGNSAETSFNLDQNISIVFAELKQILIEQNKKLEAAKNMAKTNPKVWLTYLWQRIYAKESQSIISQREAEILSKQINLQIAK